MTFCIKPICDQDPIASDFPPGPSIGWNAHVLAVWRAIERDGRTVTLSRIEGRSVTIKGVMRGYKPVELVHPLIQGDRRLIISTIPLHDHSYPMPPRRNDRVTIGAEEYTVVHAEPVRHKGQAAKWRLSIRGS